MYTLSTNRQLALSHELSFLQPSNYSKYHICLQILVGAPSAWKDNIISWTGLSVEQLLRATEDRYKWRVMVHDAAYPRLEDG